MTFALPASGAPRGPDAPRRPGGLRMTTGRWVALAIGVPVALVMIVGTAFNFVADVGRGSFHVNYGLPVTGGQLRLGVGGGDITLRQGQASQARLTGTVHYSLIRPDLRRNGNDIDLRCRITLGDCGLDATLMVPPQTAVTAASGGGNMSASGVNGDLHLSSGGGDVRISRVGGLATVDSGGGNVTADDLAGYPVFRSSGGDIDATAVAGPRVSADSGGGNTTLAFTNPPRNVVITSGGGDITLILPRGSTSYHIVSSTGGGDYGASVPTNTFSPNLIRVDSGGGNISITQAS